MSTPVTVTDFASFVSATNHQTLAEKRGWSFTLLTSPSLLSDSLLLDPHAHHWVAEPGASWRTFEHLPDHPVVHVAFADAAAFCRHHKLRLPGEREHEAASRGGYWDVNRRYSFGGDSASSPPSDSDALLAMNTWGFGEFPFNNLLEDGFARTSPVKLFGPNPLGFYDLQGNVHEYVRGGSATERILRGGSFVDGVGEAAANRVVSVATRTVAPEDTSAENIGFRCAKTIKRKIEDVGENESEHPDKGARYAHEL